VIAASIGIGVLWAFIALMFIRMVMDWVMVFNRNYRPTGVAAAALEITYTVTDPPLKALRRVLPPLRLGRVMFDIAFLALIIAAYALIALLRPYA
jgi:YggT family protein